MTIRFLRAPTRVGAEPFENAPSLPLSSDRGRQRGLFGAVTDTARHDRPTLDPAPNGASELARSMDIARIIFLFLNLEIGSKLFESLSEQPPRACVNTRVRCSLQRPTRIRQGTMLARRTPRHHRGMCKGCEALARTRDLQKGVFRFTVWACEFEHHHFALLSPFWANAACACSEPLWRGAAP
jgi:hypothetical protein